MTTDIGRQLSRSQDISTKVAILFQKRSQVAREKLGEALRKAYEDNGIGIPAAEKEKIFERGYGKNTGLGLFLAREILAITDMTIRETGTEGTGARFEIHVPENAYRHVTA